MINLPLKVPKENEEPNLNGMLKTLLAPELPAKTIIERLEQIYHIPMTEQKKGEFGDMCNLGEGILERGIERGIEQGIERGIEQGVKAFVEVCKELGVSKEETEEKVQTKFALSWERAEECVEKYYK